MTPPLPRTHPGIFGLTKDSTNTISWLSSVYEVLDTPPASRPKDGWMEIAAQSSSAGSSCGARSESGDSPVLAAVEPKIAGPYAVARWQGSSAGWSSAARSESGDSPVSTAVEPKPQIVADTAKTKTKTKPLRKFNRDRMDSARYLIAPGPETEKQAAVADLEVSAIGLDALLGEMQQAIAKLENGCGGAPLVLLHQAGFDDCIEPHKVVDSVAAGKVVVVADAISTSEKQSVDSSVAIQAVQIAKDRPKDEVRSAPRCRVRNGDFMFTPSELMDVANSRSAATTRDLAKEMETAHRRGLKTSEESRDLAMEMAGLEEDLCIAPGPPCHHPR